MKDKRPSQNVHTNLALTDAISSRNPSVVDKSRKAVIKALRDFYFSSEVVGNRQNHQKWCKIWCKKVNGKMKPGSLDTLQCRA